MQQPTESRLKLRVLRKSYGRAKALPALTLDQQQKLAARPKIKSPRRKPIRDKRINYALLYLNISNPTRYEELGLSCMKIEERLDSCLKDDSTCGLWFCSKCTNDRKNRQVIRATKKFGSTKPENLRDCTVLLGAMPTKGTSPQDIINLDAKYRARARRVLKAMGNPFDCEFTLELETILVSQLNVQQGEIAGHKESFVSHVMPSFLNHKTIVIPHWHGIIRLKDGVNPDVINQFWDFVFPNKAPRQVMTRGLRENQSVAEFLDGWTRYRFDAQPWTKRADQLGEDIVLIEKFGPGQKLFSEEIALAIAVGETLGNSGMSWSAGDHVVKDDVGQNVANSSTTVMGTVASEWQNSAGLCGHNGVRGFLAAPPVLTDLNMSMTISQKSFNAGENNPASRLTREQAREIFVSNDPEPELGLRYGVSTNAIGAIRTGRTWRLETLDLGPPRPLKISLPRDKPAKPLDDEARQKLASVHTLMEEINGLDLPTRKPRASPSQ